MPKEYMECVASMVADGKGKKEAQKICAIQYYKKHGKTPQQAAGEFTEDEDREAFTSLMSLVNAVTEAARRKYETRDSWCGIEDVTDSHVIVNVPEKGLLSIAYTQTENGIELGEEKEVEKAYKEKTFAEGEDKKPKKPKEWENVPDDEFADPENYKYPMHDAAHARNALARWGQFKGDYSAEDQKRMYARMKRLAKKQGVKVGGEEEMSAFNKEEIIEREAKIFEAGKWEDKNLEVTEAELDVIIKDFKEVPIKVEHVDSPLHLGTVSKIWRNGKDLMAKLAMVKPAWDLLEVSGAKKLSSSIKRDKSALVEVSVVRNPRIADAAVYSMDEENGEEVGIRFEADLPEKKTEENTIRMVILK